MECAAGGARPTARFFARGRNRHCSCDAGGEVVGVIALSLHQRRLVSDAADRLPRSWRDAFITQVARRLGQCIKYSDADVSRAVRLARKALERAVA
jgi:hypothetical protein